jgi:hypothetical protein
VSTTWTALTFVDTAWKAGKAPLGYGLADVVTKLSTNKVTQYYRHSFTVADPSIYASLTLGFSRDDGAVVYLNGVEIARSNMPAGTITRYTTASTVVDGAAQYAVHTFPIASASGLVTGTNVIAIEVHNFLSSSVDLRFDLSLNATWVRDHLGRPHACRHRLCAAADVDAVTCALLCSNGALRAGAAVADQQSHRQRVAGAVTEPRRVDQQHPNRHAHRCRDAVTRSVSRCAVCIHDAHCQCVHHAVAVAMWAMLMWVPRSMPAHLHSHLLLQRCVDVTRLCDTAVYTAMCMLRV